MTGYRNSLSSQSLAFNYQDPDAQKKEEASFSRKPEPSESENENPLFAVLKYMMKGKDPSDEKLTKEEKEREGQKKKH